MRQVLLGIILLFASLSQLHAEPSAVSEAVLIYGERIVVLPTEDYLKSVEKTCTGFSLANDWQTYAVCNGKIRRMEELRNQSLLLIAALPASADTEDGQQKLEDAVARIQASGHLIATYMRLVERVIPP